MAATTPLEDLDYARLISHLSDPARIPHSLWIRNQYLTHLVQLDKLPSGAGWEEFKRATPFSVDVAVGDVPGDLLASSAAKEGGNKGGKPWAIVRVASSSMMIHAKGTPNSIDSGNLGTELKLMIWLSSETDQGADVAATTRELVQGIADETLPRIIHKHFPGRGDAEGNFTIMLHGASGTLVEHIRGLPASRLRANGYYSPCTVFLHTFSEADRSIVDAQQEDLLDGKWRIDWIREEDLKLIQANTSVPYPEGYSRYCTRISTLIRDGDNIVGWVGTHEILALAMLFVVPAYRGVKLANGTSLASALVALQSAKIEAAQINALRAIGVNGPTFVTANTELENESGMRYFRKHPEFQEAPGLICWIQLSCSVRDPGK